MVTCVGCCRCRRERPATERQTLDLGLEYLAPVHSETRDPEVGYPDAQYDESGAEEIGYGKFGAPHNGG